MDTTTQALEALTAEIRTLHHHITNLQTEAHSSGRQISILCARLERVEAAAGCARPSAAVCRLCSQPIGDRRGYVADPRAAGRVLHDTCAAEARVTLPSEAICQRCAQPIGHRRAFTADVAAPGYFVHLDCTAGPIAADH